jgi:hypothetical protein
MAKDTKEDAFRRGSALSHLTAEESLWVFNPYDDEAEPELYEAWDEGFNQPFAPTNIVRHGYRLWIETA